MGQQAGWSSGRGPPPPGAAGGRSSPWGRGGVVRAAVAPPPRHQHNPGTVRERATRAQAPAQHRAHPQGRTTKPPRAAVPRYAQTGGLCTTAPTLEQAVAE